MFLFVEMITLPVALVPTNSTTKGKLSPCRTRIGFCIEGLIQLDDGSLLYVTVAHIAYCILQYLQSLRLISSQLTHKLNECFDKSNI